MKRSGEVGDSFGADERGVRSEGHEAELTCVLERYLADLEAGCAGEMEELLAAHPAIADSLRPCLEGLRVIEAAAGTLSQSGSRYGELVRGKHLGDFEIVEEVGRGGMGIVYEAIQVSLGRRVALKVLPFAALLDRRHIERFQAEAHAAARLHHRNIVPVHSVGRERGVHYYAMQFIEGQSLAAVIQDLKTFHDTSAMGDASRCPLDSVRAGASTQDREYYRAITRLGVQAAEALAYAHDCGVVHRDVKPSNLLLDEDGDLWLTDFGLAKLDRQSSLTLSGDVVGTLRYMSPEQALGRSSAEERCTDIYSLGATLYELVALEPAFPQGNRAAILNAIINGEPSRLRSLRATVPRDLETILAKAMARDPANRYSSAQAFAEDLECFLVGKPILARPPAPLERMTKWLRRHKAGATISALFALTVVLALLLWKHWPPTQLLLRGVGPHTFDAGLTVQGTLSADGKLLAYASDRESADRDSADLDIWLQPVPNGVPRRLTVHPADDTDPAFSPDGERIAFRSERAGGGIYLLTVKGGPATLRIPEGRRPRFSPDGARLAYWAGAVGGSSRDGSVFVIPTEDGEPRQLGTDLLGAMFPVWSPDGESLLCLGEGRTSAEEDGYGLDWWILPLDGSASRPIRLFSQLEARGIPVRNASRRFIHPGCWQRQHDLVFYSGIFEYGESLWAFSLPPETGTISRAPWRLTAGTGREQFPSSTLSGQLAFTSVISNTDLWALPVEGNSGRVLGEAERLTNNSATDGAPFLSADGKRLSFFSTRSGNSDVWLLEVGSDEPAVALTLAAEEEYRPVIRPDGSQVAYQVPRRGIFIVDIVDGAAGPSTRLPVENVFHPTGWTPDGKLLICGERKSRPQVRSVRVLVEATTGEKTLLAERAEYNLWQTQFSGDGDWVVCNGTSLGGQHKSQLFVFPYREGQPPGVQDWVAVSDGTAWDDKPRWSPDGNLLYFTSDRHGRCVWAQRLDEATKQRQGEPFEVFHLGSAHLSMLRVPLNALEIAVSSDRLILTLEERVGNLWLAELVERG